MSYSSQQAAPMIVYPHSISSHPSANSKGSFVPAFVVLAIVAVLTAMACLVGQIFARRYLRPRQRRDQVPYEGDHMEGGIQMKPQGQVKLDKAEHHGGGGDANPTNVNGDGLGPNPC